MTEIVEIITTEYLVIKEAGDSSGVPAAIAPSNTIEPVISGTAIAGSLLSCTTGTWAGSPSPTFAYQWKADGVSIDGATSSTYTTLSGQSGQSITCTVTATNAAGSASAASNGITVVTAPENTVAPAISGVNEVGSTLTLAAGTWIGTPAPVITRQWKLDGANISGETGTAYTVVAGDAGKTITCTETATNASGAMSATSNEVYVFHPVILFASGEKGAAIDFLTMAGAYQDSAGTVPITAIGQPLGRHSDLSGNGNHALQPASGKRPLYLGCANLDGVDDGLLLSAMPWANSSQITMVMGIRENYQTYTYGVLISHAGFNGYIARKGNDEYELTLYTPAFKAGPYPRRAAQVVDVAFDTAPITMADEIIHHVDGQIIDQTVFVNSRTYGETFATLNQLLGTWTDGSTYPLNGEIYRYICINRALTVQEMAAARAWCMAGRPAQSAGLTAELNMFQITGQSLAEGGVGAPVTTVQEYDNVMFTLLENSPAAYVPAVNVTTNLESPMYGQIGHVKALIDGDAGAEDYQMLGCNNGVGSASILILAKGAGTTFDIAMSQVVAAKAIADGQGRTFRFRAVSFVQGEADNSMSRTDYRSVLEKLASQYNEQGKRSALQSEDVIFITSQVCSNALPNVALAQLDAAIAHPLIYMSTPLYPFNHDVDGRHLVAASAKVLGGYMGLVYKRVLIDGVQWEPLRPLSHTQSGNDVTITFNVPDGPLVLDTTLIQLQTNYGFSASDASGVDIPVASVTLVDTDKVKITTSAPIPSGGWVNYAQTAQTEPVRSLGGCGNLRDSQGDTIIYTGWPMHNWCVMFRHVV